MSYNKFARSNRRRNSALSWREVLTTGREARNGVHPTNLSPYGTVVQYLFSAEFAKMVSLLKDAKRKLKVLIPEEIDLPGEFDRGRIRNAIFVSRRSPHEAR